MKIIKNALLRAKNTMFMAMVGVTPERESGDHLLEVLGVIIIAVVLLIFFKGKITNLFDSVMNSTNTKVTNLWN